MKTLTQNISVKIKTEGLKYFPDHFEDESKFCKALFIKKYPSSLSDTAQDGRVPPAFGNDQLHKNA